MKKYHFIILVISVVAGLLFSLGMCMCLVTEWNMVKPGVIVGIVGFIILFIAFIITITEPTKRIKVVITLPITEYLK